MSEAKCIEFGIRGRCVLVFAEGFFGSSGKKRVEEESRGHAEEDGIGKGIFFRRNNNYFAEESIRRSTEKYFFWKKMIYSYSRR